MSIGKTMDVEAHKNGVVFVNISPMKSDLLEDIDADWVP